ncbi:MAG: transposase [Pirellulales bacterium]|nr:transposase [Pirellulales bacterium]
MNKLMNLDLINIELAKSAFVGGDSVAESCVNIAEPVWHQKNLRKGRISEKYATYSITKCVENRRRVLNQEPLPQIILDSINFLRGKNELRLLAFCIMPDHLHLLFCLTTHEPLSELLQRMFRYTTLTINKCLKRSGSFWQDGFFDHRCRDAEDIFERAEYIERNPVRAELVKQASDWRYSSAHFSRKEMLDRSWFFG